LLNYIDIIGYSSITYMQNNAIVYEEGGTVNKIAMLSGGVYTIE
jgi:hypothetical protein